MAIACRDDNDWERLAGVIGEDWARDDRLKLSAAGTADAATSWKLVWRHGPSRRSRHDLQELLRGAGRPGRAGRHARGPHRSRS